MHLLDKSRLPWTSLPDTSSTYTLIACSLASAPLSCVLSPAIQRSLSSLVATVLTSLERMEAYCAAGRGGWFEACRV